MKTDEWKASEKRRKPNPIDVANWYRTIRQKFKDIWGMPGAPYFLSVAVISVLILLFSLFDVSVSAGKIHPGVKLAGYDIGGLTKKEALSKAKDRVKKNIGKEIRAEYKNNAYKIDPSELGLKLNYSESIDLAFEYGRDKNIIFSLPDRFLAWVREANVEPKYKINEAKIEALNHKIAGSDHKPARDASLVIKKRRVVLVKPKDGFGINRKKTELQIIAAIFNPQKIELLREKLTPKVSEKEARKALPQARTLISGPVKLKYGSKQWLIKKDKLIELFIAKAQGSQLEATLDKDKSTSYIKKLTKGLTRGSKSAKFAVYGTKVSIIASSDGITVDTSATFENMVKAAKRRNNRAEDVLVTKKQPKRTTAQAKKMGIKELISTFTTTYKPAKPRVKNIHLLAEKLDGMLVAPGETFSFNKRIGIRTKEAGFVAAPQIVGKKIVDAVGGGICQVSTTVFNTFLKGGYPIDRRSPHSLYISRYPDGRDAAVSFPEPDLRFTNDTPSWILIKGGYSASSITISFYSTDYNRKVSFETKFSGTIPYATKEVKDKNFEEGKREEVEKGSIGRRFLVFRTVTKDGKVIRKTKIRTTFQPKTRVVRVGTKKKEEDKKKKAQEQKKKEKKIKEQGNVPQN